MSDFDFDGLMEDTEEVEYERTGVRRLLDSIGTLTVANTFFTAFAVIYMEARMQRPDLGPEEVMALVQDRVSESIEELTRPYMAQMIEFNGSSRKLTVEEAVDDIISSEKEIAKVAATALAKVTENFEPFTWFCCAATGKTPDEHLNKVMDDDGSSMDGLLDDLNWK